MEELKELLKKKGLKIAENHLMLALDEIIEIGQVLVDSTENQFDDMGLNAIKMFKGELVALIDKIDGEENA